jgi:hypothetical protein
MASTNQYEEPLSHTCEFFSTKRRSLLTLPIDGSPDVFGRRHHNNGDTAFEGYERDGKQQISTMFLSDNLPM